MPVLCSTPQTCTPGEAAALQAKSGRCFEWRKATTPFKPANQAQRRSHCFRRTYATFPLTEGVDVYFLAKQMGTSFKIEDHYCHVTPVKNADRILQGLPGWEPIAAAPQETR
jgi:integrase